ncbi:MAG: DUF4397 domain-containing protein [Bacteroidota bacterium]
MKPIITLITFLLVMTSAFGQTARLQVIHNSPTPTVDVYANDDLLLDDFEFRTATAFIDVPADVEINLGIALDNSTSSDDAIANFPVTLEDGKTYVVVANGIVGGNPGFDLEIFDMGEEASNGADNVGLAFFHGSPDAPEVDILADGNILFDNISYSNFADYANVPAASYKIDVTPANDNSTIVASYTADIRRLGGGAGVVFASGFLGGDMPAFEPWVALADGTTFPLPAFVPQTGTARVQVIHNSPTPTVDVYANDDLLLNDFAFRTATPFIDVPAGVEINLGIALRNSSSAADAIANFPVTLEDGRSYVVVASGIVGGTPGFDLKIFDMGAETADSPDNVGLLFFHGSPDAPEVDVVTGGNPIFDDVSFGEFSGYINVPANNTYQLDVTPGNDNSTIVASYEAEFSWWSGKTAVVFASGFLGGDSPAFEPWVALSTGGTFPLKQIVPSLPSARVQIIHNSPTPTVDIYANDDLLLNDFAFRTATPFIDVPSGVEINLGVALRNSTSAADALVNFPVTLEEGRSYVVVATGIVGGNPGFDLAIFDMGQEMADDPANVGLLFFHGSPDAPEVDITANGAVAFDNVSYGNFSGYINVPAADFYTLNVTPGNDNSTVVASYGGDFSWWKGNTAVIFASGFLGGGSPAFEPWVALSTGGTFPLPSHNDRSINLNLLNGDFSGPLADWEVYPNPAINFFQLETELEFPTEVEVRLMSITGQQLQIRQFGELDAGFQKLDFNLEAALPNGQYILHILTGETQTTRRLSILK